MCPIYHGELKAGDWGKEEKDGNSRTKKMGWLVEEAVLEVGFILEMVLKNVYKKSVVLNLVFI